MLGGTFEYLVSSLPSLVFQKPEEAQERVIGLLLKYGGHTAVNINPIEILDGEAEKFLPESTFYIFQKIDLNTIHEEAYHEHKIKVLSSFSKFNYDFKKDLKKWRLSRNVGESSSSKSPIEKIIGGGTPLQKERKIIKHQWKRIEEFSAGHFSDVESIFAYKIKLMLLLRLWSFDKSKGFVKFNEMTEKK